ncbi:hypothetical protein Psi02_33060 [Planotetraspora silvatica]|uniref:Uncharacterized protein n=1 Tax=Planotetraspora silvatica TaxID=234614 RepID=A0A8J3XM13_9ACTN|nr:hypothetical protein [Planotetraspora silvatica]GII46882.1 hypothetical protein Psi02_33060 [Planotetraspora silvatica]
MRWPWTRSEPGRPGEDGARTGTREDALVETRPAPVHRGEWRSLPPLQRVVGPHPLANPGDAFSGALTAWRNPSSLAPLGHYVVDRTGGLIGSLSPDTAPAARPGTPGDDHPPVRPAPPAGHEPVAISRWTAPAPSPGALPVVSREDGSSLADAGSHGQMGEGVHVDVSHGNTQAFPGESSGDTLRHAASASADYPPDHSWGAHADDAPHGAGGTHAIGTWDGSAHVHAGDAGLAGSGMRALAGDTSLSTNAAEPAPPLFHETASGQVSAKVTGPRNHREPQAAGLPSVQPSVQRTAGRRLGLGPPLEGDALGNGHSADALGNGRPADALGNGRPADALGGSPTRTSGAGRSSGGTSGSDMIPTVARMEAPGTTGLANSSIQPHTLTRWATRDPAETPSGVRAQVDADPVASTLGWDRLDLTVSPADSGRTTTGTERAGTTATRGPGEPVQRTPAGTVTSRGPDEPVRRTAAGTDVLGSPAGARPDVVARAVRPEVAETRPLLGLSLMPEAPQAVSGLLFDGGPQPSPGDPAAGASPVTRPSMRQAEQPGLQRSTDMRGRTTLRTAAWPERPPGIRTAGFSAQAMPAVQAFSAYAMPAVQTAQTVQAVQAVQALGTPADSSGTGAESGHAAPYGMAEMAERVVMRLAASGIPVARQEDPAADPPAVVEPPPPVAPPAERAGRAPGDAKQDQELVGRLLEPLLRRLRAELWLERERRGDLSEPGGRRF